MLYVILGAKLARANNIFIHVGNVINTKKKIKIIKIKIIFKLFNILGTFLVPASKSILDSLTKFIHMQITKSFMRKIVYPYIHI